MQQGHLRDHPGGEGRDGTRTLQRSASNRKYKEVQYVKVFVSVVDPDPSRFTWMRNQFCEKIFVVKNII